MYKMLIKISEKRKIRKPQQVAELLREILNVENQVDRDKEHFWTIGLDTKNRIKYIELVSLGTLNSSPVHPREVFRMAISQAVAQIVLGHNHPSGDITPSEYDLLITQKLVEAGKIIGIDIIDHIIIADNGYLSFVEEDLIKIRTNEKDKEEQ